MRYFTVLILLLFSGITQAQSPITEAQLQQLEQELVDLAPDKRSALKKRYKLEAKDPVPLYFYMESWRIDTLLSMRINIDFSTDGMNETVYSAAEAYIALQDDLIREIIIMDANFEPLLEEGQVTWQKAVKQETKLFQIMATAYQSNLGTIYSHNASSHYYEKAKARATLLFQLYEDLRSATEGSLPSTQRD